VLNESLVAAVTQCNNLQDDDLSTDKPEDDDMTDLLPPDFALVGALNSEPWSLDEAL